MSPRCIKQIYKRIHKENTLGNTKSILRPQINQQENQNSRQMEITAVVIGMVSSDQTQATALLPIQVKTGLTDQLAPTTPLRLAIAPHLPGFIPKNPRHAVARFRLRHRVWKNLKKFLSRNGPKLENKENPARPEHNRYPRHGRATWRPETNHRYAAAHFS